MQIMPEIKCALTMIKIVIYQPEVFTSKQAAVLSFMIPIMKLIGGLFAELVNILLIVESEQITNVIKDFIALGIIAEIDDIMLKSVSAKI